MAYESTLTATLPTAVAELRRDERFAFLVGGAAFGIVAGLVAAFALGRVGWWPLLVAAPVFVLAAYLAVATFHDAVERRAFGCSVAAALVVLSLLAWPLTAIVFPMSAGQFWLPPVAAIVSMVLLASCWSGAGRAVYRLSGEAASIFAIIGFLGLTQIMS